MSEASLLVERIMDAPCGVPFGIPVGDLITNPTMAEPSEGIVGTGDCIEGSGSYLRNWELSLFSCFRYTAGSHARMKSQRVPIEG